MLPIIKTAADKAGGVVKLSRAIGMNNHNSFYGWNRVPAEHVLPIERASGVSRHELRPDLYPAEDLPTEQQAAE